MRIGKVSQFSLFERKCKYSFRKWLNTFDVENLSYLWDEMFLFRDHHTDFVFLNHLPELCQDWLFHIDIIIAHWGVSDKIILFLHVNWSKSFIDTKIRTKHYVCNATNTFARIFVTHEPDSFFFLIGLCTSIRWQHQSIQISLKRTFS